MLTCSAREGTGLKGVWERIEQHRTLLESTGALAERRRVQQVDWTWSMVRERLIDRLQEHPEVRRLGPEVERAVRDGELTATLAAERLLDAFGLGDGAPGEA